MRKRKVTMSVGRLIAGRRKAAGWTQQELAFRAGLAPVHVQQLEGGYRPNPAFQTIIKIARAFGCATDEFRPDLHNEESSAVSPNTR